MEEVLSLIIAGVLIPSIAFLSKKIIIEKLLHKSKVGMIIKGENGREIKYLVESKTTGEQLRKIYESELKFEEQVKKSLKKYIELNRSLNLVLNEEKLVDYLIEYNDKKIGVEAKLNTKNFKAKWISDYFSNNSDTDEIIIIFRTKVSEEFKSEINKSQYKDRVKLISSPKGKGLTKLIENILNTEFGKL